MWTCIKIWMLTYGQVINEMIFDLQVVWLIGLTMSPTAKNLRPPCLPLVDRFLWSPETRNIKFICNAIFRVFIIFQNNYVLVLHLRFATVWKLREQSPFSTVSLRYAPAYRSPGSDRSTPCRKLVFDPPFLG